MIDVLKSFLTVIPESGWRTPLYATASLASSALASLVVISSRVLIEPSDRASRPHSVALVHSPPAPEPMRHNPSPEPHPAGSHWLQITQGIEERLQSARRAAELQSAALVQVDAADFTLAGILEDLTAVMPRAAELIARPSRPVFVPRHALAA